MQKINLLGGEYMRQIMTLSRMARDVSDRYQQTLITWQEFERDIGKIVKQSDGFLNGLIYRIKGKEPFTDLEFGIPVEGEPTYQFTKAIDDNHAMESVTKIWLKSVSTTSSAIERIVAPIFDNSWKSCFRASPSGLISIKDFEEVKQYAQNTIDVMTETNRGVFSVLYCDLDNFKTVNDKLGEEEGDQVIRKTGALIEKVISDTGIVLNNGGDEFVIFYPEKSYEDSILLAFGLKGEFQKHNFEIGDVALDLSIGIASSDNSEQVSTFSEILGKSEKALKLNVKAKKKGLSRFLFEQRDIKTNNIGKSLESAFCLTKSNLLTSQLYSNVWLNALSVYVSKKIVQSENSFLSLRKDVDNFIDFVEFGYDNNIIKTCFSRSQGPDLEPKVSLLDIAMAVSHGAMRWFLSCSGGMKKENDLRLYFNKDYSNVAIGFSQDRLLWERGRDKGVPEYFSLGEIWSAQDKTNITEDSLRLALLIKIGHKELDLPELLFAKAIVVDDRPTKGGGLPDFWEVTIARLINVLSQNPNISKVFVITKGKYGAKTIEKLQNANAGELNSHLISERIGIPIELMEKTSNRLKRNVIVVESVEDIITQLTDLLRRSHAPLPVNRISTIEEGFIKRELRMDSIMLAKEDGCKVKTIKEAFPTVLEIARSIRGKEIIYDQDGYKLQELVDFKIHLTEPLKDRVPKFYSKEKDSLQGYFRNQFLSKEGLFGRVFKETNQLEEVINHVVQAVTHFPKPFATRRSILVVPHIPEPGHELTPLGLVSIRFIPRIILKKIIINYSYTWRTVEALVGFPYSIYGSVCYSEFLTKEIQSRLVENLQDKIELGFVSYIAHSLHFFMDDYGQRIAKRIVDEASI